VSGARRFDEAEVVGGGSTSIYARACGPASAPAVVLLHGIAQTSDCWLEVMQGALGEELRLVAADLRGHGRSGKPADAYDDPALWARDLAAVLDAFALERPVVVAWSYAGLMLCDYVRVHGDERLGGCAFLAAISRINDRSAEPTVGKAMLRAGRALLSPDPAERAAGTLQFARDLRAGPSDSAALASAVAQAETVPLGVRRSLLARRAANDDVLPSIRRPTLVAHGTADPLILPSMSEHNAALVPTARLSVYDGAGHSVFVERPDDFRRDLLALVADAQQG
jgi:pimeloyl-ACP methyl ester carboxylesterase